MCGTASVRVCDYCRGVCDRVKGVEWSVLSAVDVG